MKKYLALALFIVGCSPATLQVKDGDTWKDVVRVQGVGSFTVEYGAEGQITKISADSKQPSLVDKVLESGTQIIMLKALSGD